MCQPEGILTIGFWMYIFVIFSMIWGTKPLYDLMTKKWELLVENAK